MTIERIKGRVMIECDGKSCHEAYDGTSDFRESLNEARREGWTIRMEHNEWRHYCPDCKPRQPRVEDLA